MERVATGWLHGEAVAAPHPQVEVYPALWNRGVEKRRRGQAVPTDAIPVVSLAEWLDRDPGELVEEFDRLYVPKNDGRWLRRNALIAAGNVGSAALRPSIEREVASQDPVLADAASWALARMGERGAA